MASFFVFPLLLPLLLLLLAHSTHQEKRPNGTSIYCYNKVKNALLPDGSLDFNVIEFCPKTKACFYTHAYSKKEGPFLSPIDPVRENYFVQRGCAGDDQEYTETACSWDDKHKNEDFRYLKCVCFVDECNTIAWMAIAAESWMADIQDKENREVHGAKTQWIVLTMLVATIFCLLVQCGGKVLLGKMTARKNDIIKTSILNVTGPKNSKESEGQSTQSAMNDATVFNWFYGLYIRIKIATGFHKPIRLPEITMKADADLQTAAAPNRGSGFVYSKEATTQQKMGGGSGGEGGGAIGGSPGSRPRRSGRGGGSGGEKTDGTPKNKT